MIKILKTQKIMYVAEMSISSNFFIFFKFAKNFYRENTIRIERIKNCIGKSALSMDTSTTVPLIFVGNPLSKVRIIKLLRISKWLLNFEEFHDGKTVEPALSDHTWCRIISNN